MSEGPQVRLRTEWLEKQLSGRTILNAQTVRPKLREASVLLPHRNVVSCFCKGKHIFIEFDGGLFLHNHLLMRGRWRREPGQLLIPPDDMWIGLYVGDATVYNLRGQVLELIDRRQVDAALKRLGPDAMARPFPRDAVRRNLGGSDLPIAEFLLEQSLVSGVGNVAKSEILFAAGIDPRQAASSLSAEQTDRLFSATEAVLWESYRIGGRWTHRVYRRRGQACEVCGNGIRLLRLAPSRRSIYFCPVCGVNGPSGRTVKSRSSEKRYVSK